MSKRQSSRKVAGAIRAKRHEAQRFYREVVLAYDGDDCLPWPFALSDKGYGNIRHKGKHRIVSRLVCEEVNGPPPSPQHQAAHSCGNGHLACVTKGHLSWKTQKENSEDAVAHGTSAAGERHYSAKLRRADVEDIRSREATERRVDLAKAFGVTPGAIWQIINRRTWKHVQEKRP